MAKMQKYEELYAHLKFTLIKNSILESISIFVTNENLPNEFHGFLLSLEAEIKNADHLTLSDIINRVKIKESSYAHWNRSVKINKMSNILSQLNSRILSDHFHYQCKLLADKEFLRLKNQFETEMIVSIIVQAITMYLNTAILPIHQIRLKQQQDMVHHLQSAENASTAMIILYQAIMQIEQHHVSQSFAANCPYYHSKSRLATCLQQAADTLSKNIIRPKSGVEIYIEQVILDYLNQDLFYHNRNRQIRAKQLLTQLKVDNLSYAPDEILQKKHKMRTTIDDYILKIDSDFKNTYFFSKYYRTKRSRLSVQLESVKTHLICIKELPGFELETDVKAPVIQHIHKIMVDQQQILDADITQEMYSLIQTIQEAKTPQAIESIIAGHIRSYVQANDSRINIASHLGTALLTWHSSGLLPSNNEYKSFLEKLASNRQEIENDLQKLIKRIR
jgi:hypothetical protein